MQQWATALVGYRGVRAELLIELKKAQPLTASELGARFGLTANALRRHLKALEEAGIVRYRREVRGVGGPRYAYSLSEDGEALFPRAAAPTLVAALEFLRDRDGEDAVPAFFRHRWERVFAEAGLDLAPLPFADRVQLLAELLTSHGYMAEAVAVGEGSGGDASAMTLRKYNCALREVAERFPALCDAEMAFMEGALGARLERRAHLLAGCTKCEYRVTPMEGAREGSGQTGDGSLRPTLPTPLSHRSGCTADPASPNDESNTELSSSTHQEIA